MVWQLVQVVTISIKDIEIFIMMQISIQIVPFGTIKLRLVVCIKVDFTPDELVLDLT